MNKGNDRQAPNGKTYWRGLREYADTSEFRAWMENEFPVGAAHLDQDEVSRRGFLKFMGASMALAGLGMSGCRRPVAHLVPYTRTPEWQIPGRCLYYATAMPRAGGAMPLIVTTFGGRPIKADGHPSHPFTRGGSDIFIQASVLDLYDPSRARRFLHNGKPVKAADFFKALDARAARWRSNAGNGLAFLAKDTPSPTRERLVRELSAKFPSAVWTVHEAVSNKRPQAASAVFGPGSRMRINLQKTRVIAALDCDLLGYEGAPANIREFTANRRPQNRKEIIARLYAVEPRWTQTGAMADHRLRLPASRIPAFALALARELSALGVGGLSGIISAGRSLGDPGVDNVWARELARDLAANRGTSLVAMGGAYEPGAQAIALAINSALGNIGVAIEVFKAYGPPATSLTALAERMRSGEIQDLVLLDANPAYDAPADLDWTSLQKKSTNVFRLGSYEDETCALGGWHAPRAHFLESWGDAYAPDGSILCIQQMILPLWGGISDIQLLARILDVPASADSGIPDGRDLARTTFRSIPNTGENPASFEENWNAFVREGFLKQRPSNDATQADYAAAAVEVSRLAKEPENQGLEILFVPDSKVSDGAYANNGWLQELPDLFTKLTWDNAAFISPATAAKLGLEAKVEQGVWRSAIIKIGAHGRSVGIPFLIVPGIADGTIVLPLGYGRRFEADVAKGVGFDVYPLKTTDAPYILRGGTVFITDKEYSFAITQEHWNLEGRDIVREAPLDYYRKHPNFVREMGLESHAKPTEKTFYKTPPFDYERFHQWGMAVDLNACIGCNACAIACQAENNIPIVGKEQVMKGREMHWMRVDRYFSGYATGRGGKAIAPKDPEMVMQPIICMHCENAPCEAVCPVNATVHNEEGLNVMAYNRCIGTRYCANNCPYKVRRFNFFDFNMRRRDRFYWGPLGPYGMEETLKMQKNPNVTVRMRGVIEKCTFCVQRLEAAKIERKSQNRAGHLKIPDGGVRTACQDACPAGAIIFGDLSNPESEVSKLQKHELAYSLLDYLNVKPRVKYLARVRNPNPKMPDAEKVGMHLIESPHSGDKEEDARE